MKKKLIANLSIAALLVVFIITIFLNTNTIINYLENVITPKDELIIKNADAYERSYVYTKYQVTNNFEPKSYNDILNIYYTVLNKGWKTFFFYCPDSYKACLNDVSTITKNETLLSSINNYVSPYNSYSTIKTAIDNTGKVTIKIDYNYDQTMIDTINTKMSQIISSIITANMTTTEKIRAFHNYIINNTSYDSTLVDTGVNNYKANTAYGPLINGYGICSGYSDAMALFLDYLKIPNYKIASTDHVWNYVYLDGAWYHLDLTWDDPVASNGSNRLIYTYFLISTDTLKSLNTDNTHTYDENLY